MTKHITKRIERKKEKLEDLLQQVDNLTESIETDQRIEKKYKSYKTEYELIKRQFKILKYKIKIQKVENIDEQKNNDNLKILNVDLKFSNPFNVEKKTASNFIYRSLSLGHKLALNRKNVLGLINCPINKNLLSNRFIGVTEYFAHKCNIKKNSEVIIKKDEC